MTTNTGIDNEERLLRIKEVSARTGLSRSTIYLLIQHGHFPAPAHLTTRTVAWSARAVSGWIKMKLAA